MRAASLTVALALLVGCGPSEPAGPVTEATLPSGSLRTLNGTQLFVREVGSGPPVVVVHGGPVLEHGYFLPHLLPLTDDYRLVFYDQRLSGRSAVEVDSSHVTMAAFVGDIDALRESLGADRIHLLAHSWGGHLALQYAIAHPERVQSLILANSMAGSSALWREEEQKMAAMATEQDYADRQAVMASPAFARFEPEAIEKLMRIAFRPQVRDVASLESLRLYFPTDYAERSRRMGALGAALMSFDLHDQLAAVTAPALVVNGEIEPAVRLGGPALVEALPNARHVIVKDAGHFPFVEQPEAFLTEVRAFLHAQE